MPETNRNLGQTQVFPFSSSNFRDSAMCLTNFGFHSWTPSWLNHASTESERLIFLMAVSQKKKQTNRKTNKKNKLQTW